LASNHGIAAASKILTRAFAGTFDAERLDLYRAALEDISDADLLRAVAIVVKTYTQPFIPPPAVIRAAIGADRPAAVDADSVIRSIAKLKTYTPTAGMIPPPVETVRQHLGDVVAHAYALAGAGDLWNDNEVTADIARRDFRKAITAAVNTGGEFRILGTAPGQTALPGLTGLLQLGDGR
jgi:hypothetical protein